MNGFLRLNGFLPSTLQAIQSVEDSTNPPVADKDASTPGAEEAAENRIEVPVCLFTFLPSCSNRSSAFLSFLPCPHDAHLDRLETGWD